MKLTRLARCLAIALAMACGTAAAQTEKRATQLYRCGPEGRDLRDAPCPDKGAAQQVEYDQPSAAQQRETRERSRREAREADALERERLRREAQNPGGAIGIRGAGTPPAQAASAPAKQAAPLTTKKPRTKKPKAPRTPTPAAARASG